MSTTVTLRSGDRPVQVVSTDVADGDFAVALTGSEFDAPRQQINPAPWTWLKQVHGTDIVLVDQPGHHGGAVADGAATFAVGCPIAVTTADCAPVVLTATTGVAVVHAGWRGALAGVVGEAAAKLTADGGSPQDIWLGPCIGPEGYEFSEHDLSALKDRFGTQVESKTANGLPALDMFEVIAAACSEAGWPKPVRPPSTANNTYFSHRTRGDKGRQTTVAWIEPNEAS